MSDILKTLSTLSPQQRLLFERRLKERGITLPQSATIPRHHDTENIPLSFAQQRLWFIQQLEPMSCVYNVPCVLRLSGNLQIQALEKSLNELRRRHTTLRTYFTSNTEKQPIQVIAPWEYLPLEIADTENPEVEKLALAEANHPFDLSQPLLRYRLLRLEKQQHILLLTTHHIISDRWSVGVFLRELSLLYSAFIQRENSPLPELTIQYYDWAVWQRQQLQGDFLTQQIDYWQKQLGGELPILQLSSTQPATPTFHGSTYAISLSPSLSQAIKALAAKQGVTLFMLLLASFQILLHRYTGEDDLVIGTDIVNRDRQETESLIGLLVNTLVLRTSLAGNPTVKELLSRVREVTLGGFAHQYLPFEKLVEVLNPDRNISQMMPLFQVKFDLQLAAVQSPELPGLTLERLPFDNDTAKYELRLNLQDTELGITGQFEYSRDLFEVSTIARMAEHWVILLESIINDPEQKLSQLSILTIKEQELLINWNQTSKEYPSDECLHQLFETQVEKTPENVALIFGEESFTYQEINIKANQLAHHLRSLGVQAEIPVGICLERSPEMVIGILAILKAGGVYVPLDPRLPESRLEWILEDAKVSIILTQTNVNISHAKAHSRSVSQRRRKGKIICLDEDWEVIQENAVSNPIINITPENLAYLIYTSGSTGKPKGVMIEHRSPVCLLYWARDVFSDDDIAGVLASTSICFDLSIFEIFVPLSWGGKVILAENALELPNLPAKNQVTLINTVPSAINQLLYLKGIPTSVKTVNLAGEPLSWKLLQQLEQLPNIEQIYNLYGPSEDTTYSTYIQLKGFTQNTQSPPIGYPITNTQVYVLDKDLQPVPVGVSGELYISGAGLARGYWQRPDLTAERFLPNSNNVETQLIASLHHFYKTGDRVRYLSDGNIEYLGRLDNQVKIRGYRIELGEIEAILSQYPDVQEAVVIADESIAHDKSLVAYIAPANLDLSNLRQFLAERLPGYMIPTNFVSLEALPHNSNGKIDRQALPKVEKVRPELRVSYLEPRTNIEKNLAEIWQETLQLEQVGVNDNFFALGGHSLLGIQVIAKINESLSLDIPLKNLFLYPTIAELSAQIEKLQHNVKQFNLPQIQPRPEDLYLPFPLTDIQQAYLIGRNAAFELGNVATHGYQEIETVGLSIAQMEQALQHLIERHDMLRLIVQPDGQQRILPEVPPYKITVTDLREVSHPNPHATFLNGGNPRTEVAPLTKRSEELIELRKSLSHQIIPTHRYPLFEIHAVLLDEKIRFCISFDVLMGDASSFRLLGTELVQLLQNPDVQLPPINLSFRDYVLAEKKLRESTIYAQSQAYWQSRLATLPPAPDLPLTQYLSNITQPHFVRRSNTLDKEKWQRLKQQASQAGITPSGLLLAAFAEILAKWSKKPDFTLNLTLFNRLPLHPDVNQIVGDFTASLLLEINKIGHKNFWEFARCIQTQLWEDLDHRYFSGVEVLRQLARSQQRVTGALMPVVFTSTLTQNHREDTSDRSWSGDLVYSLSQTSQVYFDHQVGEVAGALIFNWDTIDDLFPPGMLDEMFQTYCNFLEQLTNGQTPHSPLSHSPTLPLSPFLLHTLFFDQVAKQPEAPAIITPEQTFTYQQVSDRVCHLAQYLHELGAKPNQLIAVVMDKGWEQAIATLAILTAGSAYIPIDPQLPTQRRLHLLQETQAQIILTQSWLNETLEWENQGIRICVDTPPQPSHCQGEGARQRGWGQPKDLAYIIYTSGSTGTPKGVMIDHQGAVNTILDINQRFNVTASDSILALSSLGFDLSVYDIFGILAAGGAIVIPESSQRNNPNHWAQLIAQHQITIWNSVPALMQLLVDSSPNYSCQSLQLVLLSGDWIPLNLPERIRTHCNQAQIISLGGATEASIWSIFYPIDKIDPTWKSIPYGYSLTNQQVCVLNHELEPCPTWAIGEIYIAGLGVAKGYWQQPELTAERFLPNPDNPTHLLREGSTTTIYKTGDLGRYLPDGTIEFLGREDFQVKVNGYRIELGEIETALQQHPAINQAVVTTGGNSPSQQQLLAYVVLSADILDTSSQLDFKLQQQGLRNFESSNPRINLPTTESRLDDVRRQSYRQFLQQAVSLKALGEFLDCMRSHQFTNSPLPKYRYASAGSLYPVQTYIYIKPNRVEDLSPGIYYYHQQQHQLIQLSDTAIIDSEIYGINQSIFAQAAFAIFLIADLQAIDPIYADKARDFCLLEAGYIGQLLMDTAPDTNLGLCPIGALEFETIRQNFNLHDQHLLLHSFVGGCIHPDWKNHWQSPENSQIQVTKTELMTQKIRQFLQQKLPEYMIPTLYIPLETLPLTPNGKIDRRALPQPTPQSQNTESPKIPPTTELEKAIANLWESILQIEIQSIHDNFFDLGGNSLSATQIITQIRSSFQLDLPIREFFLNPTLAAQVNLLQKQWQNRDITEDITVETMEIEKNDRVDAQKLLENLDNLSEEEVDLLLNKMLINGKLASD